jgi:hypothetical protein
LKDVKKYSKKKTNTNKKYANLSNTKELELKQSRKNKQINDETINVLGEVSIGQHVQIPRQGADTNGARIPATKFRQTHSNNMMLIKMRFQDSHKSSASNK